MKPFRQLLMLRARTLSGPFFHPWALGSRLIHGPGNFIATVGASPFAGTDIKAAVSMDFTTGTLNVQGTDPGGAATTFTRASTATYFDANGVRQTAATNVPRFHRGTQGLVMESGATNYFKFSSAPATQVIALAAGTYTFWIEGAGSMTLSGVATGTVLQGSPITATVLAGDVTCTISGSVSVAQVENSAFPTSFIPTSGSAVTRAKDDLLITPLQAGPALCFAMDVELLENPAGDSAFFGDTFRGNHATGPAWVPQGNNGYWRLWTGDVKRDPRVGVSGYVEQVDPASQWGAVATDGGSFFNGLPNPVSGVLMSPGTEFSVYLVRFSTIRRLDCIVKSFQYFDQKLTEEQIQWLSGPGNMGPIA